MLFYCFYNLNNLTSDLIFPNMQKKYLPIRSKIENPISDNKLKLLTITKVIKDGKLVMVLVYMLLTALMHSQFDLLTNMVAILDLGYIMMQYGINVSVAMVLMCIFMYILHHQEKNCKSQAWKMAIFRGRFFSALGFFIGSRSKAWNFKFRG